MFPDIDANDGDEGEERVLVRGCRNLKAFGRRIVSL